MFFLSEWQRIAVREFLLDAVTHGVNRCRLDIEQCGYFGRFQSGDETEHVAFVHQTEWFFGMAYDGFGKCNVHFLQLFGGSVGIFSLVFIIARKLTKVNRFVQTFEKKCS